MARKWTNALIDALDQKLVSYETVARACLNYMSEDEVREMIELNALEYTLSPELRYDPDEPEDFEVSHRYWE